jgi:hypothetical protein
MTTMVLSRNDDIRHTGGRAGGRVAPVARPAVRLTRRGRLVVTMLLTMLVLAAFLVAGGASVATREAGDPVPTRTVEVQQGQTLWAIASEIAEPGEIRDMVYTIERLNSLPDATLTEGQVLAVPAG